MSASEKALSRGGAPLVHSSDEDESDHGSSSSRPRTSAELRQHDQRILESEEEIEKLITERERKPGIRAMFRRKDERANDVAVSDKERKQLKRDARRGRRRRRKKGEESQLMYEMEEGGHRDSAESSGTSTERDRTTLEKMRPSRLVGRQTLVTCHNETDICSLKSHSWVGWLEYTFSFF